METREIIAELSQDSRNKFVISALRAKHKLLFSTALFAKNYFWLQDKDGTIYLERYYYG